MGFIPIKEIRTLVESFKATTVKQYVDNEITTEELFNRRLQLELIEDFIKEHGSQHSTKDKEAGYDQKHFWDGV